MKLFYINACLYHISLYICKGFNEKIAPYIANSLITNKFIEILNNTLTITAKQSSRLVTA